MIISNNKKRKGMILLVVVAFLAMFTVMGLTYLLHADNQLKNSIDELLALDMKEDPYKVIDFNPSVALDFFLEKFLYDQADGTTGGNAIRGHSLARNIYGGYEPGTGAIAGVPTIMAGKLTGIPLIYGGSEYKSPPSVTISGGGATINATANAFLNTAGVVTNIIIFDGGDGYTSLPTVTLTGPINDRAFSGIGKLNKNFVIAGSTINEWKMVNYSFHSALNPERLNGGTPAVKTSSWNAPYTYPDQNNFYLGWLKSDATKVVPSFHRDYIFGSMAAPFTNPNWTNAIGKYLTPRPRPVDHNGFPYPDADGMDVKNLEGYPGGNDSIWIDVGSPVYTALDGRKYKIMVAPLILDLDGRINVNVAGNVMGAGNSHASNQGWGPWEVNLSTALVGPPGAAGNISAITEAQQINLGFSAGSTVILPGVYGTKSDGTNGRPGGTTLPTVNPSSSWGTNAPTPHPYLARTYSMLDFNAKSETGANAPISFLNNSYSSFPAFSGNYTSDVVTNEMVPDGSHPSFVNPQRTKTGNSKFTNNEMASLIRWSGQGSAPKATNLVNLLKNTIGADYIYDNSTMAIRNRITTLSADIQQPTLLPYSYTAAGAGASPYVSNFGYGKYPESDIATNPKNLPYPLGTQLAFPGVGTLTTRDSKADFSVVPVDATTNKITGVSSVVSYMPQINLNRSLTDYPRVNTTLTNMLGGSGGRFLDYTGYNAAKSDRQKFATEIFNGLKLATGVAASDVEANRYLAQLAVNMVDYIDRDEVMTQFTWKYDPAQLVKTVPDLVDPTQMISYYPCKHEPTHWEDNNGNILTDGMNPVLRNASLDERVYGVELNKVVVNEVYAEIINDPTDTFPEKPANSNKFPASSDKPFQVHFWVELMNPLPLDPIVPGSSFGNNALLEQDPIAVAGDSSVYQLEIRNQSALNDIFKPDNPLGVTRAGPGGNDPSKALVSNFQPAVAGAASVNLLAPVDPNKVGGAYLGTENAADGFIVLGSNIAFPNDGPVAADVPKPYSDINNIANIKKNELKYTVPIEKPAGTPDPDYNKDNFTTTLLTKNIPSIVLRRLANPFMRPQNDAAQPNYNPYVAVDVMNDIKVNDAVTNATDDKKVAPPAVEARSSVVRRQPYQDANKKNVAGLISVPDVTDKTKNMPKDLVKQPQHTFLRQNGTLSQKLDEGVLSPDALLNLPFSLINHLDRKLINSLEILNVSGCKPAEVTQRFANLSLTDSSKPYNNILGNINFNVFKYVIGNSNYPPLENKAPWLDEASNLYRFLALADIQGYQQGTAFAGRQIGKININNIWDKEVFNALCDANANNNFTQAEVDTVFTNFMNGRSPLNLPAFGDNPLWGFGVGKSTGGDNWTSSARGIDNSILRGAGTGNGVFDLPVAGGVTRDSSQRKELLSKIANSITTKSNVFGVWITTGYFEVINELTDPPTLGAEINKIAGRNIRHRMFAIVDRTNMVNSQLKDVSYSVNVAPVQNVDFGAPGALILKSVVPPYADVPVRAGMLLTFEPNTDNEETVLLRLYNNGANPVDPLNGRLVGDFQKTHNPGGGGKITIINRGNPGPWVGYKRAQDRDVVPYAEIIE